MSQIIVRCETHEDQAEVQRKATELCRDYPDIQFEIVGGQCQLTAPSINPEARLKRLYDSA
jgi:hypothetical protein